jgi:hypothetical protein
MDREDTHSIDRPIHPERFPFRSRPRDDTYEAELGTAAAVMALPLPGGGEVPGRRTEQLSR